MSISGVAAIASTSCSPSWPEYRGFCDGLFFAVDADFPAEVLPDEAGLIVADGMEAELLRGTADVPLAAARRRALLHRFAMLAAGGW